MARSVSYQNQVIPGTQTWDPAQSGFGYDSSSSMRGFGYTSGTGTARPTPPENPLGQSRGHAASILGASVGYGGALPLQAQQAQKGQPGPYAPVLTRAPSLQASVPGYNTMQSAMDRSKSVQPLQQKPQQTQPVHTAQLAQPINQAHTNTNVAAPSGYSGYQMNNQGAAAPGRNAQVPQSSMATSAPAPVNISTQVQHKPHNSLTATAASSYQYQYQQHHQQQQNTHNKPVNNTNGNGNNNSTSVGYGQTNMTMTQPIPPPSVLPPPALPLSQPTHTEIVLSEEALAQLFALEQSVTEGSTVPLFSSIAAPAVPIGHVPDTAPKQVATTNTAPALAVKTPASTDQPLTLSEADLAHLLELEQAFELSQSQPSISAPVVPLQTIVKSSSVANIVANDVATNQIQMNDTTAEADMAHLSEDVMAQLLALEESAYAEMSAPASNVVPIAAPIAASIPAHTAPSYTAYSAPSKVPSYSGSTTVSAQVAPHTTMSAPSVPLTPAPLAAPLLCMRLVALDVVDDPTRRLREVRAFQPGSAEDSSSESVNEGKMKQPQSQSEIGGTLLTVELTGDW